MTNKELQDKLKNYPDDMQVNIFKGYDRLPTGGGGHVLKEKVREFTNEDIIKHKNSIVINPPVY